MKFLAFLLTLLVSSTASTKTIEQEMKELDALFKEVIEQYQVETELPECPVLQTYWVKCA